MLKIDKNIKLKVQHNKGYCPCKVEKIPDNMCPCLEFRTSKKCICGLFKEEDDNV